SRDAVALAEQIDDEAIIAESLADLGFIQLLRGRPGFADSMRRALAVDVHHTEHGATGRARWLAVRPHWFHAVVLGWTDQLDAARAALLELRVQADASGHEHFLPDILNWLGRVECFADRWHDGLSYAHEADTAAVQADL